MPLPFSLSRPLRRSDLVGMYAHENVVNLTRYALPLEEFVRGEEERSARLEATLLPQYRATGGCVGRVRWCRHRLSFFPGLALSLLNHLDVVASSGISDAAFLRLVFPARR